MQIDFRGEIRGQMASPDLRAEQGTRSIGGFAAVFNSDADIGGYWIERIKPGAFAKAIKGDVRSLFNHDSSALLGRTISKTLELFEDDAGLQYRLDLPRTTDGDKVLELIERGDLTGNSFGFKVTHDEWDETGDVDVRTIHEVELYEVGPVTFPAYEATSLWLRSSKEIIEARSQIIGDRRIINHRHAALRLRMKANLDLLQRGGR